jgi:hypothetical protein
MTNAPRPRRRRKRSETVNQFIRQAVARSDLYQVQLGEDIAGRLVHHAERLDHHYRKFSAELARIQAAARDVGMTLPVCHN